MANTKMFFKDEVTEELLSMSQAAARLDMKEATLRRWYKGIGFRTIQECQGQIDGKTEKCKEYNTIKGLLTIPEIHKMTGHSFNRITNRAGTYGWNSPAIFYKETHYRDIRNRLQREGFTFVETRVTQVKFNRRKVCNRVQQHQQCEYYFSCQDYRISHGKHHPRHVEDGSCYSGKAIEFTTQRSTGYKQAVRIDVRTI